MLTIPAYCQQQNNSNFRIAFTKFQKVVAYNDCTVTWHLFAPLAASFASFCPNFDRAIMMAYNIDLDLFYS